LVDLNNLGFSLVEIVTQTYVVQGRCGGLTEYQRLVDLLNNPDYTHLQIFDPKIRPFSESTHVEVRGNHLFLDKMRIFFAVTLESAEESSRREALHRLDRVEKDRHEVLVFASPFRIEGFAYVVKGADPTIALPKLFHAFVAITGAKAVHQDNPELVWERDFLVVNGHCIEMLCSLAAKEQPPKESPKMAA